MRITANEDVPVCSVGMVARGAGEQTLYETHTTWQGLGIGPLEAGQSAVVDLRFTAHLLAGRYWITPQVTDPAVREHHAVLPNGIELEVRPAPMGVGIVDMQGSASVTEGPAVTIGGAETTGPIPLRRTDDTRATGT